jgi:cobalamin biosynthesis Co2+ chelatase CbiK
MNCSYDDDQIEFKLEWYEEKFEKLKLERDALWVKTQEDEKIINELRDAINEKNRWKEAALVVMSRWDKVSDYINKNGDVNDLGKSISELCLKYLMERDKVND